MNNGGETGLAQFYILSPTTLPYSIDASTAMIPFVLAEQSDNRCRPNLDAIKALFHIFYSGTHATIEQRAAVTEGLLGSAESEMRSLGLQLLEALLDTDHMSPTHSFEFGARVRDYGYWPSTREEKANWFATALQVARQFASKSDESASTIRSMVAQSIWSHWFLGPEVQEQFEAIAAEIAAIDYWQEGWIAVRSILSRPAVTTQMLLRWNAFVISKAAFVPRISPSKCAPSFCRRDGEHWTMPKWTTTRQNPTSQWRRMRKPMRLPRNSVRRFATTKRCLHLYCPTS